YTFVFRVPRRYVRQLVEMGWDDMEIDVPADRTVEPGKVPN
ncbi:unnamed protein product, partial [marine sediment metagenome]